MAPKPADRYAPSRSAAAARARAVESATCDCAWAVGGCGDDDGTPCWSMCCDDVYARLRLTRSPNPFAMRELATTHAFRANLNSLPPGSLERGRLHRLLHTPTAIWVDRKAAIGTLRRELSHLVETHGNDSQTPPPTLAIVVYNLPNRDCNARASGGEICCERSADGSCNMNSGGTCRSGLHEYRDEFIAPLATLLAEYAHVPVAVILEPDSLPNLVTNLHNPRCGSNATRAAYEEGLVLALATLHRAAPRAALYVDAGHGAWLGWEEPSRSFVRAVCRLGLHEHARGFSTNVANYNPLGLPCPAEAFSRGETPAHYCRWVAPSAPCCTQQLGPCERTRLAEYNSGAGELMYAQLLARQAQEQCPGFAPRIIIDTSRNGNAHARAPAGRLGGASTCSAWCNVRGARLGPMPTADTALPELVDAYVWIKTPGESDGCGGGGGGGGGGSGGGAAAAASGPSGPGVACVRRDEACAVAPALGSGWRESAPEAGSFYAAAMVQLASPLATLQSGALAGLIGTDAVLHGGWLLPWLIIVALGLLCACRDGGAGAGPPRPLVRSGSGVLYAAASAGVRGPNTKRVI
tara:strand:- start:415 stop:2154 length:1740 start_codon:yes stop_codon:yes gene_type:complete